MTAVTAPNERFCVNALLADIGRSLVPSIVLMKVGKCCISTEAGVLQKFMIAMQSSMSYPVNIIRVHQVNTLLIQ